MPVKDFHFATRLQAQWLGSNAIHLGDRSSTSAVTSIGNKRPNLSNSGGGRSKMNKSKEAKMPGEISSYFKTSK